MGASLLALAKSIYYVYRMLRPVISQQGFFSNQIIIICNHNTAGK